ncbi:MAG: hypothetical protein KJP00_14435 [Bacteroidia bacterium]|nr:hypothetical protein [Bacteroidia bacterium]
MTKLQLIVIASCVALFGILYFALDTKPPSFKEIELSRSLESSSLDIDQEVRKMMENLPENAQVELGVLDAEFTETSSEKEKTEILKKISGFWYNQNRNDIAGYYAEQVAENESTAEAWNIAGSTYSLGLQQLDPGPYWEYCYDGAIKAFENAISIDPDYLDSKINLALCYVERAPENNPMKGITMLLDLNKQYPKNVAVMNQLGKLAVQTNQLDRARERFEAVLRIEENNKIATCYLSQVYKGLGDIANAAKYQALCDKL